MSATIGALLAEVAALVAGNPTAEPRAEAEILIAHVLGVARTRLWARPEEAVAPVAARAALDLAQRRATGEPIAYLVGRRAFWTLELEVGPAVLIPRPETELIVEQALARLPAGPARVADLGTGSGAVALALAAERPRWHVVATDSSADALGVARRNAERLGLGVDFRHGDWAQALRPDESFDLIASNPPYVAAGDPHLVDGDLPWEPRTALVAGADGLDAIRGLAPAAFQHLADGGWLLLEHGATQGDAVRGLLARIGLGAVRTMRDLSGLERLTMGRRQTGRLD